ncbi:MAG: HAMP domain-containing protein, partial [Desulfobacterales bacterium]
MNITIRTKIVLIFTIILAVTIVLSLYSITVSRDSLADSVGISSIILAENTIKRMDNAIYQNIHDLQLYSREELIQKTVFNSNTAFQQMDDIQSYVKQRDREWISTPQDKETGFMRNLAASQLSEDLRNKFVTYWKIKYGYDFYEEIFVTNKFGANAAQSQRTSGYYHADEEWWNIARENGFYVSQIEFDESARTFTIIIAVSIYDDKEDFAGVIKAVISIKGIIKESEILSKKYDTTEIQVITDDGKLIYSSKPFRFLEDLSSQDFYKNIKNKSGYFISKEGEREKLFSYAKSAAYKDFSGMNWVVITSYDTNEVFKSVHILRNNILLVSSISILIILVISIYIYLSITNPLYKMIEASQEIAEGNLDKKVDVTSKDEIGQLGEAFNVMTQELKESY